MGQNKLISRNEMSAKQLVISKNATIDHRVNPNTGKAFFTCGDIAGYISPNALKALNEGQDIDAFRYAEVSKDNGQTWVPCLMVVGNQAPVHSTMSKRVSMLLKQLNIGLDTLNRELKYMGQPIIDNINAKISDLNYVFLVNYFQSQEMNALDKATEELNKCRRKLADFFLREFKPIDQMSEIEKSLYFKWIISYGCRYISFQRLFPNANSLAFSETIFEQLYKWYEMWMTKSEEEKQKEEKKARDERWNNITWTATPLKSGTSIDEETAIMSALKNGNGDAFGFDKKKNNMRNNSMQESADTLLKNGEWRQAFPCAKRAMESSLEEMDKTFKDDYDTLKADHEENPEAGICFDNFIENNVQHFLPAIRNLLSIFDMAINDIDHCHAAYNYEPEIVELKQIIDKMYNDLDL